MTAPLILGGVCLYGLLRGTDVFAALLRGAKDGLGVVRDILPALLILFPAIAMEHFEIEQTRVAHDALGDAYNTALVCTHLDLQTGLDCYDEAQRILSSRPAGERSAAPDGPEPIEHVVFPNYASKADAFSDETVTAPPCPVCGGSMPCCTRGSLISRSRTASTR